MPFLVIDRIQPLCLCLWHKVSTGKVMATLGLLSRNTTDQPEVISLNIFLVGKRWTLVLSFVTSKAYWNDDHRRFVSSAACGFVRAHATRHERYLSSLPRLDTTTP